MHCGLESHGRERVEPFTEKEIALATDFAAEAIAPESCDPSANRTNGGFVGPLPWCGAANRFPSDRANRALENGSGPVGRALAAQFRRCGDADLDHGRVLSRSPTSVMWRIADSSRTFRHFREVPIRDVAQLLDYLIGAGENCGRKADAECCRRLEIEGQVKGRCLLYRNVSGLRPVEHLCCLSR